MTHKPRRWTFSVYQKRIIALPLDGMECAYSVHSFAKFSVCYGTAGICRVIHIPTPDANSIVYRHPKMLVILAEYRA
jgi:hypothetical protein